MASVYLACPLYNWQVDFRAAAAALSASSRLHSVHVQPIASSLIPVTCNTLWCDALNLRHELGLKWFAMLHADTEADNWWIDTLISEAESRGADMLSAAVPLKDAGGVSTTAIHRPGDEYGPFCRITQAQLHHESFPQTFDVSAAADALEQLPDEMRISDVPRESLLVNTGCMVCRIDKPWSERVCFDDLNAIEKRNGQWRPIFRSEDWFFSRRIAQEGGKVMATTKVRVRHHGSFAFDSSQVWGQSRDL